MSALTPIRNAWRLHRIAMLTRKLTRTLHRLEGRTQQLLVTEAVLDAFVDQLRLLMRDPEL